MSREGQTAHLVFQIMQNLLKGLAIQKGEKLVIPKELAARGEREFDLDLTEDDENYYVSLDRGEKNVVRSNIWTPE